MNVCFQDILEKIQPLNPRALIIDSIQTVYLKGVAGSAGAIQQVKECTSALLRFAKKTNVPVLLIGHVTKSGDIAGPRVLEHIVDVVLYMEGEENLSHRLLRSVKNRYGSTDEVCNGSQGYSILYPYIHYSLVGHISMDLFVLLIYVITLNSFIVAFFILFRFLRYIYLCQLM
ncbi:hypothetical protein ACFX2I_024808 [Malus domestica]